MIDMARQRLLLVTFFFLLGIASVYPRLTQNDAQAEKIRTDLNYENLNFDQKEARSSRVIRGLPDSNNPYPGYSARMQTKEQQSAAKKQVDKPQREKEDRALEQIRRQTEKHAKEDEERRRARG